MTKHMVKIQFAAADSSIHVICKTATFGSLAAIVAHTILSIPIMPNNDINLESLNDKLTADRISFFTNLLPVASIGGSVEFISAARSILPNRSPYFEILLKNQRLRQQILITLLCHEAKDALNPLLSVQLSNALRHNKRE